MYRKLIDIAICLLFTSPIAAQQYKDKPATHGMLLMGRETIYASHLPMFHSPHDYQIILELKLDMDGNKKYLEDRKKHPKELVYTIEPEVFVLPEMVNDIKKFKASLYRGHFERGGTLIAKDIPMIIEKVIYFHQFSPDAKKPEDLKYILFGNDKEQFLAHQISARPDFDEILAVKIPMKNVLSRLSTSSYGTVEFGEKDNRKGLSRKSDFGLLMDNSQLIQILDQRRLYFELGDLD